MIARRLLVMVCAVATIAACSSSPSSPSPGSIAVERFQGAANTFAHAQAVHYRTVVRGPEGRVGWDLHVGLENSTGRYFSTSPQVGVFTSRIRKVGSDLYVRGSDGYWTLFFEQSQVSPRQSRALLSIFHGSWIHTTVHDPGFAEIVKHLDVFHAYRGRLDSLAQLAGAPAGSTFDPNTAHRTQLAGAPVYAIPLRRGDERNVLYVSATHLPSLTRITVQNDKTRFRAMVDFDEWNRRFSVAKPRTKKLVELSRYFE